MPLPQLFANVPTNTRVAGSQLDLDLDKVASMGIYPSLASGSNDIALVPFVDLPTLFSYQDYQRFSFVATEASTGPVTVNFAGLGALPWYAADGVTQITSGQVALGEYYDIVFIQALNSGGGGFISAAASSAPSGPVGPHTITLGDIVQIPAHTVLGNDTASAHDVKALTISETLILLIGTDTPSLVAGAGISVTGSWPDQTIAITGTGVPLATGQINVEGLIDSNGAILQSLGIASVTHDGAGLYTVNFSSPFDGPNYACLVSGETTGGQNFAHAGLVGSSRAPGSIQVKTTSGISTPTVADARFSILATGVAAYRAGAVHFDGATWVDTGGLLSGVSNSPLACGSFWIRVAANTDLFTESAIIQFLPNIVGDDPVLIQFEQSAGNVIMSNFFQQSPTPSDPSLLGNTSSGDWPGPGVWINVLWSAKTDLAAANKIIQIAFNDVVLTLTVTDADSSFAIDYVTNITTVILFSNNGSDQLLGDMADFWFAPGQFIDFTVQANRRKFISATGKPVFLGADGSLPTGVAPAIFFTGDATDFPTNAGTGGASGAWWNGDALTNASTSPSD